MDQRKIGAFIAACRKRQKLTQSNLAERLGVTDRSVSNWENGVCLPDASLFGPLCELLRISVNELFAGEYVLDEHDPANENLLALLERRLYDTTSKEIGFDEFSHALKRISQMGLLLRRCESRQDAIAYLADETGLPQAECAAAYDFYIKNV